MRAARHGSDSARNVGAVEKSVARCPEQPRQRQGPGSDEAATTPGRPTLGARQEGVPLTTANCLAIIQALRIGGCYRLLDAEYFICRGSWRRSQAL